MRPWQPKSIAFFNGSLPVFSGEPAVGRERPLHALCVVAGGTVLSPRLSETGLELPDTWVLEAHCAVHVLLFESYCRC